MSEKIGQVERKIRNSRAIYECWACHRMVESVNSRNHWCKACREIEKDSIETEVKVQPTNETKKELKPSMFYALELVGERNWSAPNIGLYWKNKGDIQRINERNLRDFEVQSGLKRGLIRIVEEEQEPIEPKISEEIKQKTDTASGGDW